MLTLFTLIGVGSVVLTRTQLEIQTDLESLLPEGTSSVQALEESRARKGSTDSYTIAVKSPDVEANVKMIKALAAEIEKWPEAQWVQVDRDNSFFAERALLYLPEQDLIKLRDQIQEEVKKEKRANNPFFVDPRTKEEIRAENKERWKLDRWLAPDLGWRLGLEQDLFDSIVSADKLGLQEEAPAVGAEAGAPAGGAPAGDEPAGGADAGEVPAGDADAGGALAGDGKAAEEGGASAGVEGKEAGAGAVEDDVDEDEGTDEPSKLPPHLRKYLLSPDGKVGVLLASLSQSATDMVKSRELMERGTALIEKVGPANFHPEMEVKVTGAYRNFKEVEAINHDSTVATLASAVLVLLVLLAFFRNGRSLLLMIVPLVMGVLWSAGLTALTYGRLNISTLFVFSMLIGMGIDFGIHFYARILEEYRGGAEMEEAIALSIAHTGRAMLSAALTTIVALLTLLTAHFQGFVEFGVIASYGIALCLVAAVFVMPPAIFAMERVRATARPSEAGVGGNLPLSMAGLRKARMVGVVFIVLGLVGAAYAVMNWEKASFEHDFRNLRGKGASAGISYGAAVGRKKDTSPAIILGDSPEQMREVHELLAAKMVQTEGGKGSYLKSFITLQTYVPPEQDKRLAIIKEIHEEVSDSKLDKSKGQARVFIDRMRKLSAVEPFTIDDVPEWARRTITEKDGTVGHIGYLYSSVRKWDAKDVAAFQDELGVLKVPSAEVPIASSGFIVADVVRTVKSDAIRLMPFVFAVLLLILLIDLRDIKGSLLCLLTMGLAVLWTVGVMAVFDLRLGLYNMIVLPMVLGTGIDGAIHLYHRFNELGPRRIVGVVKTTGASVAASSLTTLAGFSGLLFVDHLGVKSIGTLAVAGIASTLIAVFSFAPGLLILFFKARTVEKLPNEID